MFLLAITHRRIVEKQFLGNNKNEIMQPGKKTILEMKNAIFICLTPFCHDIFLM